MEQKLLLIALLFVTVFSAKAQVLVGDMDDDGDITVSDVTAVVNTAVGKTAKRYINAYEADNTSIVGTWTSARGSVTFNDDGTTSLGTGYTYKYRPMQGRVVIYNASGIVTSVLNAIEVENNYLVLSKDGESTYTYYYKGGQVSGIVLSQSTIAGVIGQTYQLTATVTPSDAAISALSWSSSNTSVATVDQTGLVSVVGGGTATITASAEDGSGRTVTCTVTVPIPVSSINLDKTSLTLDLDDNDSYTFTATVLPANADDTSVTWESSDEDVVMVSSKGKVVANDYGTATITCTAKDGSGVKATCTVTVKKSDTKEAVDLGLSVKWATCNVGADNPEDYGLYFAWGEKIGYTSDTSDGRSFDWASLKYCSGTTYKGPFTKYVASSTYGTVDNKTVLESSDDAATANWGGSWRMPTYEEQTELRTGCYWEWTSSYKSTGVAGYIVYKVKSDSDKGVKKYSGSSTTTVGSYTTSDTHIFLPAAGCRSNSSLCSPGSYGYYWSSSLDSSHSFYAYCLGFFSGNVDWSNDCRYYGRSVRPVCQ